MDKATQDTLMSSGDAAGSPNWETPRDFFDKLDLLFGPFELDAAATAKNSKCPKHLSAREDALSVPWTTSEYRQAIFCNPPYGRGIDKWIRKAEAEARMQRRQVFMLLPARTDAKWFHDIVWARANRLWFVRGRIRFRLPGQTHRNASTFPSIVVLFDATKEPGADGPRVEVL